jgi:MarR family transcriptional regulator, organic hydroperoxide resistance regulator
MAGMTSMARKPPTEPSATLHDQLCFALYAASRAVTNYYRPLLDELGITYPQYLVLLVLWERGEITVKDLGAQLQLDSGTLSPLLKRLEGAGLLHRTRRADDERSVSVSLTERGEALRGKANCLPQAIQAAMGLDDTELKQVRQAVQAIAATIRDSPPRASARSPR